MNNALDIRDLSFHWDKEDKFTLKIKNFLLKKIKSSFVWRKWLRKINTIKFNKWNFISVSGTIFVKNNLTTSLPQNKKDEFRANNIGVIFQQFNILDYISPLQNILLPCYFTDF